MVLLTFEKLVFQKSIKPHIYRKQKTVIVLFHIQRVIYVMENIYQNQLYIKRFFTKIIHVKACDVLRNEYTFPQVNMLIYSYVRIISL